jgi:hypothetical protein
MKIDSGTWQVFEQWHSDLKATLGQKAKLLFRGQGSSQWGLKTTLDRREKLMFHQDYYSLILAVAPAIETLTGVSTSKFDSELIKQFTSPDAMFGFQRFPSGPDYEYLVYLRHHGFPSPLLDWSRSPYVAAFFAFRNEDITTEKRSVYAFCERPEGIKGGTIGEPAIRTLGPYVRSHQRHFRQQSEYTVCKALDEGIWRYTSHQYVVDHPRPGQDLLWRFDISNDERIPILKYLDGYNLNAYSLFDSEETLLETLWLREHIFKPVR